jgi:esterase/lipase
MTTIYSAQFKNLFFTYVLSKGAISNGAVILLDGLPSNPQSKNELIQELSSSGYDVFFPRYEGTWESKGTFLERAPSEAIIEFIEALKKGEKIGNKKYLANSVFLLGASFGGGVTLDIATKYSADKVCVVSPAISFKAVNGIETLGDYLKKAYSKDYRFNLKDWQKLIIDEIWNLKSGRINAPNNVWIVTGKNDNQVKEIDVIDFAEAKGIRFKTCDLGHITLSKIPNPILLEIIDFFSK